MGSVWVIAAACLALALTIAALMWFFGRFDRETRRIEAEMRRAEDGVVYEYWRREMRCHYLCLIPFVNADNVQNVYSAFFHKPRHAKAIECKDGFGHVLAPVVVGVCLCAVCLCGTSWAWFSASTNSGVQTIRTPEYRLTVTVTNDDGVVDGQTTDGRTEYALTANGSYTVTASATGTENAAGYAILSIGDDVYYTAPIFAGGELFVCTVTANEKVRMTVVLRWGSASAAEDERISNGGAIVRTVSGEENAPQNALRMDASFADTDGGDTDGRVTTTQAVISPATTTAEAVTVPAVTTETPETTAETVSTTTETAAETTASSPETTASSPETTASSAETTASLPETISAPSVTTVSSETEAATTTTAAAIDDSPSGAVTTNTAPDAT